MKVIKNKTANVQLTEKATYELVNHITKEALQVNIVLTLSKQGKDVGIRHLRMVINNDVVSISGGGGKDRPEVVDSSGGMYDAIIGKTREEMEAEIMKLIKSQEIV